MNVTATLVFVALFGFVTVLGFIAARWKRADLHSLNEWGLAGRRFGTLLTWFLLTAYAILIGGELNAETEQQTAGPPSVVELVHGLEAAEDVAVDQDQVIADPA